MYQVNKVHVLMGRYKEVKKYVEEALPTFIWENPSVVFHEEKQNAEEYTEYYHLCNKRKRGKRRVQSCVCVRVCAWSCV